MKTDYKKLLKQLEEFEENEISEICGNGEFNCIHLCADSDCIVVQAITAIEALLKERQEACEAIHGNCKVCKNNPIYNIWFGQKVAVGKCITCKYSCQEMLRPLNNTIPEDDNWEWDKKSN